MKMFRSIFRRIFFLFLSGILLAACQPPTPAAPIPHTGASPMLMNAFRSSSGKTTIQYYTYQSAACTSSAFCGFRGIIHLPPNYTQTEVFLSGFSLETATSVDKLAQASAQVSKYRYDPSTGEMEVGVNGQLDTASRQNYSYQISFVVLLTNASAKLTRISTGCGGVTQCHLTATLAGAIPAGMQYIGLGTRLFHLGSSSGPINANTLSMHIDSINIQVPPDVQLDYLCAFQDASAAGKMFCEWDASIIAFDPAEIDRNDSAIFPQYTMLASSVSSAQQLSGQAKPYSGGTIAGFLDALEGVTFFYGSGQEYPIWLVDSSISSIQTTGSPPTAGKAQYGLFLGTKFGDRMNGQPYSFQLSRAAGLLR